MKLENEAFLPQIPAIVTGDLNATPDSEEIHLMKSASFLRCLTDEIGDTFHGFGKGPMCQIDYIFAHPDISCVATGKWTDREGSVYLSDHYPLWAEITLP